MASQSDLNRYMFLAGLHDRCDGDPSPSGDGKPPSIESFTMIMMDSKPGDYMKQFHSRQPVVLDADSARL